MKKACKNILSALLCAVLLCGSALAFDLEAFWTQNGAALEGKGVFQYGVHEFQDRPDARAGAQRLGLRAGGGLGA